MKHAYWIALLLLVFCSLIPVAVGENLGGEELDARVGKLLKDLEELYSKGVGIEGLVKELNKAIDLYYNGSRDEALEVINNIEKEVQALKSVADRVALEKALIKYASVAAALSIPLVVYFALPRLYLYLWYYTRRKWIVEGGRE